MRKQFTSYERDEETNLDFAQARYYAKGQGRFTTVDPIMITPERLAIPQGMNLYSYTGNNPLTLVDKNGLDSTINDKTKDGTGDDEYKRIINNRKDPKFQIGINDKNMVVIVGGDGKELGAEALKKIGDSLKDKSERGHFDAINDHSDNAHATINLVRDDPDVDFGGYVGKGENTVDLGDLSKVPADNASKGGLSQFGMIGHEMMEAYSSTKFNVGMGKAHTNANFYFPGLGDPYKTRSNNFNGMVTKTQVFYSIGGNKPDTMGVQYSLVNPVPVKGYAPDLKRKTTVDGVETIPVKDIPK